MEPNDKPRTMPDQSETTRAAPSKETAQATGVAAGIGAGCLGLSILPVAIAGLFVLALFLLLFLRGCPSPGDEPTPPGQRPNPAAPQGVEGR
ncbi:MAG TPA: hypothetical protein PKB10_10735 [Tepidisphaeraceae bacterium]|nr:hypothetical protein [Tepidisphaeraceae bacterium]